MSGLKSNLGLVGLCALGLLAWQACTAGGNSDKSSAGSANGGSGNVSSGPGVGGFNNTGGNGSGGACAETKAEANTGALPADIIFVVDNSGSMNDEAVYVQQSMNDFSNIVVGAGIDAHVILIAADSNDSNGICVPPPLGSGSCPNDELLPAYRHVAQSVGSSNSLNLILSTYPQWQSSLRAGATKTIAVITDDDSGMSATDFTNQLLALDPSFMGFVFHGIVAPYDLSPASCLGCSAPACTPNSQFPPCDPCCGITTPAIICVPLPASEGTVYKQLIQQTGGTLGDLCTQNFNPVFQAMATAVVNNAQVPCVYDIPPDPNGQSIDPGKVNVEYKPDPNAAPKAILNVPGGQPDCGTTGGWYYDDATNPTKIILCDTTCNEVQNGAMPSVTVKFGCATQIK